jgi:hypothetical protein
LIYGIVLSKIEALCRDRTVPDKPKHPNANRTKAPAYGFALVLADCEKVDLNERPQRTGTALDRTLAGLPNSMWSKPRPLNTAMIAYGFDSPRLNRPPASVILDSLILTLRENYLKPQDLSALRRAFARLHHPDIQASKSAGCSMEIMKIANAMIDKAIASRP